MTARGLALAPEISTCDSIPVEPLTSLLGTICPAGQAGTQVGSASERGLCPLLITRAHILHDQQVGAQPLWARAGTWALQRSLAILHATPSWAVIAGRQVLHSRGLARQLRGLSSASEAAVLAHAG